MQWQIRKVKLSELKEYNKNPRRITKKGIEDLTKSIQAFGVAEPLVVNTDLTVCGGHGRLKVLKQLNYKEVECYIPDQTLTEKQFEELNIRLNKNIAGEFDFDILANQFEEDDLLEWGFEEFELGIDIEELNRLKEWNESAEEEFQPGDKSFDINIKFESARNREIWAENHGIKPDKVNCGQWTINL